MNKEASIAAVIMAAGMSRRMGSPKMTLPWGETTIIGQVVMTLQDAGLDEIWVITGKGREEVEAALQGQPVRFGYNPHHETEEMLTSFQLGLRALLPNVDAAMAVLGDQPQIDERNVRAVVAEFQKSRPLIVAPSYHMKRGHPWIVDRVLWPEILALKSPATLRDFLNRVPDRITYVNVDTPSILEDLDTPEDYQEQKPEGPKDI